MGSRFGFLLVASTLCGLMLSLPAEARATILVGNNTTGEIHSYSDTGSYIGLWATVAGGPTQIDYNSIDGKVYINTSTGIKRYSATGTFDTALGNTVSAGMAINPTSGNVYTGVGAIVYEINRTSLVQSTLKDMTGIGVANQATRSDHSLGAVDVAQDDGDVLAFDDVSGPNMALGITQAGGFSTTTSVHTVNGRSRTYQNGIHTNFLQNNGTTIGGLPIDLASSAGGTRLYFTGSHGLGTPRDGLHGSFFDDGGVPTPGAAGSGIGLNGVNLESTAVTPGGEFGQVSLNTILATNINKTFYVVDDGGTAYIKLIDDTALTVANLFSDATHFTTGRAYGIAFLASPQAELVPEPSAGLLLLIGMAGIVVVLCHRNRAT